MQVWAQGDATQPRGRRIGFAGAAGRESAKSEAMTPHQERLL